MLLPKTALSSVDYTIDAALGATASAPPRPAHVEAATMGRLRASLGGELADTFAKVTGVPVPYKYVDRRPGDVAACYANTALAEKELGWKANLGVERMCQDAWRWQSQNPNGY